MVLKNKNSSGQALIESVIALPIFITLGLLFFFFLYESLWFVTIESILNEGLVCESTLGARDCLKQANQKANSSQRWGHVHIFRSGAREWTAQFYLFKSYHRSYQWKTLRIQKI